MGFREAFELEIEIGSDVFAALRKARQREGPQIDPRQQIIAKFARRDLRAQITIRPRDELEITLDRLVRAERQEGLVFERTQQHRLLVETEFANFIKEDETLVCLLQQPWAVRLCTGEGAAFVTEERRHRMIAPQRGAVHFDEPAAKSSSRTPQIVDPAGQHGFARTRRPHDEDGRFGVHRHELNLFNELVESLALRGDAALQKVQRPFLLLRKAGGQTVILREIEIDDFIAPRWLRIASTFA